MRLRLFNSLTLALLASVSLHAQTAIDNQVNQNNAEAAKTQAAAAAADANKKDKKQSLNFEDELIEGTALRPDLFSMFQKNNFKFIGSPVEVLGDSNELSEPTHAPEHHGIEFIERGVEKLKEL